MGRDFSYPQLKERLAGVNGGQSATLKMKNEYEDFKALVSSRNEQRDMPSPDEVGEDFWSNVANWFVLLGLMLLGLVAAVWLYFFY
jgi:hypothetical protein